jgi:hypothetical protein
MYSFRTYETGQLRRDGRENTILFEDLQRCFEVKSLMRPDSVIDILPVFQILVVIGESLGYV